MHDDKSSGYRLYLAQRAQSQFAQGEPPSVAALDFGDRCCSTAYPRRDALPRLSVVLQVRSPHNLTPPMPSAHNAALVPTSTIRWPPTLCRWRLGRSVRVSNYWST